MENTGNTPEAWFNHGAGLAQQGQWEAAVTAYQKAIALQPNFPEAQANLGNALRKMGQLEAAVAAYRQAITLRPQFPEAYYNLGVALKDQGQTAAAIAAYRQVIALRPDYARAYYNLGNELEGQGQWDEAAAAYRQAIALQPRYPNACFNLGLTLHALGRLEEAIAAFRQTIALQPDFAEAHSNLGLVLHRQGRLEAAIEAHRQAIQLNPQVPEAHYNLGAALEDQGRTEAAIAAYRQALALRPHYAHALVNLGNALRVQGQPEAAVAALRQAIAVAPGFPEAHYNLGIALHDRGELELAAAAYGQALALQPGYARAYNNLGVTLRQQGKPEAAIAAHRQAIALAPDFPEALSNLGVVLGEQEQWAAALVAHRQAVELAPDSARAYSNLGAALAEMGQLDAALAAYQRAIALAPDFAEGYNNLGIALKDQGQLDAAIDAFRRALALRPGYCDAHSNLIVHLHYHPGYDGEAIAAELRRWNDLFAAPLKRFIVPHSNDQNPARRLRIGYVSPDFADHPVGRFMLPLLARHDRQAVEIVAYSQTSAPDAITAKLRPHADVWRNVAGLADGQMAEVIREDRIDILVDLALHTAHHRLLVFARHPAPVQVTFAGYPGSTGLEAMDWRLSDPWLDPPGGDESAYSERTLRLPDSFWCYDPMEGWEIPVTPLPALEAGVVTFGCLNNFCKVNAGQLGLWAQVMRAVEGSRLVLLAPAGSARERTLEALGREGIEAQRVEFVPRMTRQGYLEQFQRIDAGLDTYPYNGHTTSLDGFWMGVPVVTLVGPAAVARAGWCQLSNLGLPELAGRTPEEFVRIAVGLAGDRSRLRQLRSTLRQRMQESPLMDQPRFARHMEAAYREMWRQWCRGEPQ